MSKYTFKQICDALNAEREQMKDIEDRLDLLSAGRECTYGEAVENASCGFLKEGSGNNADNILWLYDALANATSHPVFADAKFDDGEGSVFYWTAKNADYPIWCKWACDLKSSPFLLIEDLQDEYTKMLEHCVPADR